MSKIYGVIPNDPVPDAPAAPVLDAVTAGYASLSWDAVSGATLYQLYKNGAALGGPTDNLFATDTSVIPLTLYSYQLQAFNASGGSALGTALAVTTSANYIPEWSIGDLTAPTGAAFSLNLNSVCDDNDAHSLTYTISSGSVPGLSLSGSNYTGTPTTIGAYSITFDVYDGYDHAPATITFTVFDPDVVAPTVPTGVSASANGSTVTVSWTASTDASGVAYYKIYRGGVLRGTSTASPYTDLGVPDGSYSYTVSAVDSSLNINESAQSSAALVTVAVAPTAPDTPISFTASPASSSVISLAWAPGPNGTTPDDYDLDFSTASSSGPWTSISIGLVTSYQHTGRTAATQHWYRIRAGKAGAGSSGYAAATATTYTAGEQTLLTEDFSSATWYQKWHSPERVRNGTTPYTYNPSAEAARVSIVAPTDTAHGYVRRPSPASGYALKVTIPTGTNAGTGISYFPYLVGNTGGAANTLSDYPTELYLEYYLRFGSTWPSRGSVPNGWGSGKLPGFGCHPSATQGSGGNSADGFNGWSARGRFSDPCLGADINKTRIGDYVYHADMPGTYGSGGYWMQCPSGLINNQWFKVKFYIKMNTGTNANGILRGWVNDVQYRNVTDYRFDLSGDWPIARAWMNVYYGGQYTLDHPIHLFFTDVRIWVP